jgi:methylated-DNA-[protein]-cysteine S-methyltransferase
MKRKEAIHHYYSSLVGWLELRVSDKGVRSISYVGTPRNPQKSETHPVMVKLIQEFDKYFSGAHTDFTVPLDLRRGTPFQRRVWDELRRIPYGRTVSYRHVAEAIGDSYASRAVGSANKANSIPILIPCHRVVKSDGSLGGYDSGVQIKMRLLELEGAHPSL